jgi:hypothetical protein
MPEFRRSFDAISCRSKIALNEPPLDQPEAFEKVSLGLAKRLRLTEPKQAVQRAA